MLLFRHVLDTQKSVMRPFLLSPRVRSALTAGGEMGPGGRPYHPPPPHLPRDGGQREYLGGHAASAPIVVENDTEK